MRHMGPVGRAKLVLLCRQIAYYVREHTRRRRVIRAHALGDTGKLCTVARKLLLPRVFIVYDRKDEVSFMFIYSVLRNTGKHRLR